MQMRYSLISPKIAFLFEDIHEVNPLPHYNLYKGMRDRGVLVSLDGHGGDELFCGYESSILHALPSLAFQPFRFLKYYKFTKMFIPRTRHSNPKISRSYCLFGQTKI